MHIRHTALLALGLFAGAATAHAHRVWILPAITVFSGEEQWASFDAAVSNNLFYPNHRPVNLAQVEARDPEGQPVELQNATGGRIRSSFELQLNKQGTYVVSLKPGGGRRPTDGSTLFGSYTEAGKPVRWRGTPETLASEGVATKTDFKLRESGGRSVVTFVTLGKPSTDGLKPSGSGFEVEYLTHPNDLTTGESASFRFLIDGKPAAGAEVSVVRGDDRYRDEAGEVVLKADSEGLVKIEWPVAGRYWLEASHAVPGTLHDVPSEKVFTYIATYEVLPE